MAISRSQMRQQVSKPGVKKTIKKLASALKKGFKKTRSTSKKITRNS